MLSGLGVLVNQLPLRQLHFLGLIIIKDESEADVQIVDSGSAFTRWIVGRWRYCGPDSQGCQVTHWPESLSSSHSQSLGNSPPFLLPVMKSGLWYFFFHEGSLNYSCKDKLYFKVYDCCICGKTVLSPGNHQARLQHTTK